MNPSELTDQQWCLRESNLFYCSHQIDSPMYGKIFMIWKRRSPKTYAVGVTPEEAWKNCRLALMKEKRGLFQNTGLSTEGM